MAVLTAACGGSGGVSTPTDNPAAAPVLEGHAVVQGTVAGAQGLQVGLAGAGHSVAVDPDGRFVLSGLPAGNATLSFDGSGVSAQLTVPDLRDGHVTTINVTVAGPQARLNGTPTCTPEADTFFTGTVESITPTRIVVSGREVDVTQLQKVWRGPRRAQFDAVKVGDKVKVWGMLRGDGVVVATEISVLNCGEGEWVTFSGRIESLVATGVRASCTGVRLVVAGRTVLTNGGTSYKHKDGTGMDPSELAVGQTVYVEGWQSEGGSVTASLIRR